MTIAWVVLVEWTIRKRPQLGFLATSVVDPCESAIALSIMYVTVMDELPLFLQSLSQVSLQVDLSLRQKQVPLVLKT